MIKYLNKQTSTCNHGAQTWVEDGGMMYIGNGNVEVEIYLALSNWASTFAPKIRVRIMSSKTHVLQK